MVHNCVVQVPVNAIGKKCRTTFLPLKSDNDTCFFADDTKVNCGAGEPGCNDIDSFFLQINNNYTDRAVSPGFFTLCCLYKVVYRFNNH